MRSRLTLILDLLLETGRYLALSPRSRLRQRAALRELDHRLLADIGVTRAEATKGRRLQATSIEPAKASKHTARRQESSCAKPRLTRPDWTKGEAPRQRRH
jgi:hypothetical protein